MFDFYWNIHINNSLQVHSIFAEIGYFFTLVTEAWQK